MADFAAPPRRVALVVAQWAHSSSIYAWSWLKESCLRHDDHLLIVHVGRGGDDAHWRMGGPLVPDLDTALAGRPHSVHEVAGPARAGIRALIAEQRVHLLVVGDDLPGAHPLRGGASVGQWVKENATCAFCIVRAGAVRPRMRLAGSSSLLDPTAPAAIAAGGAPDGAPGSRPPSPPPARPRRVLIAFPSLPVGAALVEAARAAVLLPRDEVYLAHVFPKLGTAAAAAAAAAAAPAGEPGGEGAAADAAQHQQPKPPPRGAKSLVLAAKRASALLQIPGKAGGGAGGGDTPLTEEAAAALGGRELAGAVAAVHAGVVLRGEPRAAIRDYCEAEDIDLLIVGSRSGGRLRKAMAAAVGGGSVSSYLLDHAPCPAVVVPHRAMGLAPPAGRDDDGDAGAPPSPRAPGGGGGRPADAEAAPPGGAPAAEVAELRRQLAERDAVIAALRARVAALEGASPPAEL